MARQWQSPSGAYVNETGAARQWQIPDGSFVNQAADTAAGAVFSGAAPLADLGATGTIVGTAPVSGTFTTEPMYNNVGGITALASNQPINFIDLFSRDTSTHIVRKTGGSTNASGIASFVDAAVVTGTSYRFDIELTNGTRIMPVKAAT